MRLERLCDVELRYEGSGAYVGFGSYGTGVGSFAGDRLSGSFRFSNRARLREDGRLLPEIAGALTTPTGATVLVQLAGVVDGGRQRLAATFETDAGELAWLNGELALFAGEVDHDTGTIAGRLYVAADESRPRSRS